VADSGVGKISNILTNMRNLAQSGVSDTLGADERQALKDQLESYITQIDDIVTETTWNGTQLLDQTGFTFQTGADSGDVTTFSGTSVTLNSSASGLNLNAASLNSTSGTTFQTFMNSVDSAIDTVSAEMSNIGALINRLGFKEEQLAVAQVNVEASYNRIMNADMAMEQLESTKFSILQQTSITMLSQANSAPQGVLQLFR
jgi:flagellin